MSDFRIYKGRGHDLRGLRAGDKFRHPQVRLELALMRWSLQEAKNRFSRVVDAAVRGAPQLVTRHGKPAVIVLAAEEYERLARLDRAARPALSELLLTLPQDDRPFELADLEARDVDF